MAEPTPEGVLKILPILVPGIASILVPVVGWVLSSVGIGRKQRQIEYFIRRLDLGEKLSSLADKGTNEKDLKFLKAEFDEILNYLKSTPINAERPDIIIPLDLAKVRSIFLFYNPHSIKGWVYHVIFYFSALGILGGVELFLFTKIDWREYIYVVIFYVGMALVFHRLAVKNARKLEEQRKDRNWSDAH